MNSEIFEKTIVTARFVLEPINSSHAERLFESLQNEKLYKFIPTDPPKSIELLIAKYDKWAKRASPDAKEIWLNYAIFDKKRNKYVGTIQATLIENSSNYIAYEVFPEFWKQNIATEVLIIFIEFLFSTFNILEITAHIDTRNIASIQLIKKLNFNLVQLIENADYFKNSSSDEYVYSIRKDEYDLLKIKSIV